MLIFPLSRCLKEEKEISTSLIRKNSKITPPGFDPPPQKKKRKRLVKDAQLHRPQDEEVSLGDCRRGAPDAVRGSKGACLSLSAQSYPKPLFPTSGGCLYSELPLARLLSIAKVVNSLCPL